ncbi:MAG: folylpolyglutamate synthase/dihydrofolate synthase family protein [Pseudomonadota bacterium]
MESNRQAPPNNKASPDMSLNDWLSLLETLHPNPIDLGLERVSAVAARLSLLPIAAPVITVAGTNGKGSTVAVIEALLTEAGMRTGVFTSPHLVRYNERIRVGCEEATDEEIVAAFMAIEAARGDISLTYFEFSALAALEVCRARDVDVMILEVGLGGRLDAVNIVDARVAVITRIDLDHQQWLGDTRELIAIEKAGIMRANAAVVIGDTDPPASLLDCAQSVGAAPVRCIGEAFGIVHEGGQWQGRLRAKTGQTLTLSKMDRGSLLPENIVTALQASLELGWQFDALEAQSAVAKSQPKGRCQTIQLGGIELVLDVAHNPSAVYNLVAFLNLSHCSGKTICVFSSMNDKDIDGMIDAAGDCFDAWFLAEANGQTRVAAAQGIADLLHTRGQRVETISHSPAAAFRAARAALESGDRLVVFGSFVTVTAALMALEQTA